MKKRKVGTLPAMVYVTMPTIIMEKSNIIVRPVTLQTVFMWLVTTIIRQSKMPTLAMETVDEVSVK